MALGFLQVNVVKPDAPQLGGQLLRGFAAVARVLGQRGNGWDPEQIFQLVQKSRMILMGKCNCG